jgi:hypothetical protein
LLFCAGSEQTLAVLRAACPTARGLLANMSSFRLGAKPTGPRSGARGDVIVMPAAAGGEAASFLSLLDSQNGTRSCRRRDGCLSRVARVWGMYMGYVLIY